MKPTIKFVRLTETAKIPSKKHATDSGYDICADENFIVPAHGGRHTFKTGIAAVMPDGYALEVRPRSGLTSKLGVVAQIGTVDNGYQNEIGITIINHGSEPFIANIGDRIAQLVVERVYDLDVEEMPIEEFVALEATSRGMNGFGSTGRA